VPPSSNTDPRARSQTRGLRGPGEARRVACAGAWLCALLTANNALRPLRDAMGVAAGVEDLHWLFTATFAVMLAAVPVFGLAVARFDRRRLVTLVYRLFAAMLLGFFASMQGWLGDDPSLRLWTARVFFVWMSVFNLFVLSLFWSVMADLFTRAEAGRLFGMISIGGSIGAIAGPIVGGSLALWLTPGSAALVAAILLEFALVAMRGLDEPRAPATDETREVSETETETETETEAIGGGVLAAIPDLLRSPTLLGICAYVVLMTMSSTMLYFVQAEIVAAAFDDDASRTALFASVDLAVNLITVLTQALLSARIIARVGLGWALASVALICAAGFVSLAAAPVLGLLLAVQIARRASNYAVAKPAREALYTAVDRSQRYRAKSLIDTVIYRGGDALTGWLFAGLTALGLGLGGVALVAAPLAGVWAVVGRRIGRRVDAAETGAQ